MRRWRLAGIIVVLIALATAVCVGGGQLAANLVEKNQPSQLVRTPQLPAPHLRAQGQVVPARWAELGFVADGVLAEVLVAPGQTVQVGEVLARLDTQPLSAKLTRAQLDLEVARAQLAQLKAGPTEAERMVAQFELAQAEADLDRLTAGPMASDLSAAQAAVQGAERELENAKDNLVVVQKSDVVAKNVRDRGYEHNWFEANYGEYKNKFERGEIDQTRLDLEWNALLTAKERLDAAQAEADLALGTAQARVAQAEENLRQAKAHLADLQREPDARELAVAQLALEKAQAQSEQLTAGPDPTALLQSEAAVQIAELALQTAQADLEAGLLTAPFDGTVVAVNGEPGESVGRTPFITLADLTAWQVETVDVDEWLVARVAVGQVVELTFPAFDRKALEGVVTSVAPRPKPGSSAESFYTIVVMLNEPDDELRWGMTARLDFGEEQ
jgi:HlyD family secretion protein